MKNFDIWNEQKKKIDESNPKFYKERDIWWCKIGLNVGLEQDGSGEQFQRPILVLKGLSRDTFLAIPITSSENKNKNRISIGMIDDKNSFVIISQIRTLDTKRLTTKITRMNKDLFETIRKAVKDLL